MCEAQEREAGLGAGGVAELVRLRVGLLRLGEVAAPPPDFPDLIEARGGDEVEVRAELFACLSRLLLGAVPVPLEPHDLRPVDATGTGEAAHVEPVAPAVGLRRPLCRAPAVAERLARMDRDAVDHPGRERVELAADRTGGRLVQKRKTLAHLARHDERRPLENHGHRLEVPIAKARCELSGTRQLFLGRLELPHHQGARSVGER